MAWGREGGYRKYFMNEILLGLRSLFWIFDDGREDVKTQEETLRILTFSQKVFTRKIRQVRSSSLPNGKSEANTELINARW